MIISKHCMDNLFQKQIKSDEHAGNLKAKL